MIPRRSPLTNANSNGIALSSEEYLASFRIAAVIPAFNEAAKIEVVLRGMPAYLRWIIVVDDHSGDGTAEIVRRIAEIDSRIHLVQHAQNQGVGAAMVSGFQEALNLEAQIVVKLDADGQMGVEHLPALLQPLILGEADYTKGNRFRDFRALSQMPPLRRAGNTVLSFLTKAAVGYWNCFDPCNGYVAIRTEVLTRLPLEKIDRSFFFETSMLAQLNLMNGVVRDVPMPAQYADEVSHLSISRVLYQFPPRLLKCLLRRLVLKNFLYDFSLESLYLLSGIPLLTLGSIYGLVNWIWYASHNQAAPTGTVVIPALCIILGFQLLLSAIGEDVRQVPHEPLCSGPLPADPVREDSPDEPPEFTPTISLR